MSDNPFPMHVGIVVMNAAQLASVYALLGGASASVIAASSAGNPVSVLPVTAPVSGGGETPVQESQASVGSGQTATNTASPSEVPPGAEGVDAHGWPWSADMHASTGNKTKDGLWRMKVGVSRPDPKPGYPLDQGNSAAQTGATSTPTSGAAGEQAASATGANAGASPEDEDDEFAAFRAAAAQSDAKAAEAVASTPARKYSDADLAVLCNDAAVKLGDPAPVKAIIAEYVGEGAVPHSRNIPDDRRAAFVAAVEAKAGISFKG